MKKNNKTRGFLLFELLVAVGIMGLVFVTLFLLQTQFLKIKQDGIKKTKAVYYAEEAMEAVHHIRSVSGWAAIPTNGVTKFVTLQPAGFWTLDDSETPLADAEFSRTVKFDSVNRETLPSGRISATGVDDPSTRKITVSVSWESGAKKVEIETYLTAWKDELD